MQACKAAVPTWTGLDGISATRRRKAWPSSMALGVHWAKRESAIHRNVVRTQSLNV